MQLVSLGNGTGFLKAGLLGFAGSGKTYTAVEIALGVRKQQGLKGPVAMFDTEAAAQYVAPRVKKETGLDLLGHQSRALADAVEFLRECQRQGVSVAIIDSVTHLWREVCESYLKQKNEAREKQGRGKQGRLEFQDWGPIKATWEKFSNLYLNIPMHVLIAGRAGYEYDYEDREDGTGKDLVKTGIKMKTEGEFGYEPSLLIQMERVQMDPLGKLMSKMVHRATILKDRFGVMDGKECNDPTYEFFKPFVDQLTPGTAATVDTTQQTNLGVDESGDSEWHREKRMRAIYCEEIQGELLFHFPGMTAPEKVAKAAIVQKLFGTVSWTAVEAMDAARLKAGRDLLPAAIKEYQKKPDAAPVQTQEVKIIEHFSGEKKPETVKKGK